VKSGANILNIVVPEN